MEAHYYTISVAEKRAHPGKKGVVRFASVKTSGPEAGRRIWEGRHTDVYVDGKRAARKVAAEKGATPWNF